MFHHVTSQVLLRMWQTCQLEFHRFVMKMYTQLMGVMLQQAKQVYCMVSNMKITSECFVK